MSAPIKDIREQLAERHIQRLGAEIERWCWKAIAQGVGNRVWVSSGKIAAGWNSGATYEFAILAPGDPIPGEGSVFGPFSTGVR